MAQVKTMFSPNAHLRGEIMRRWQQLSTAEIDACSTDPSRLIAFLESRYGFARGRAEKEVDLFYLEFQDRLRMAA